jgi:N-methylhydantoinase A
MGRIPPALIGGGIRLDAARARAGIAELGKRLGSPMSVESLAEGIIEIANWNQANRIRQMTIQRGIDPREFALLSFGGSGPAQSPAVMELLGMKACIVPRDPGNLSAFGLLAVDWRTDHIATRVTHEDALDPHRLERTYAQLERDAVETLRRDGIDPANIRLVREADVRYVGQSMEVRVQAPGGAIDATFAPTLAEAFHAAHEKAFGYSYRGKQKVEVVNFCVSGFGLIDRPQLPKLAATGAAAAAQSRRKVYFGGAFVDTPIYTRSALPAGARIDGPAVIEEFGSTTVAFPSQTLTVDPHGIMIVRKG